MLVRFACLAVSNTFAALRLLPMSSREKDAEILALRHQLRVLLRQLGRERVRFERTEFCAAFDEVLADADIQVVLTGVRMPRMNAVMERWVGTCRRELLDRMLIWNQAHLLHALHEFESHCNLHRPHRSLDHRAPLHPAPEPITCSADIVDLNVRRRDRPAASRMSTSTQPDLHG